MRTLSLLPLLVLWAAALPSPAAAEERRGCRLEITGEDEIVRTGDVVVGAGEHPREVIALDGSVRVKAGATVAEVVALGGHVVVEDGAVVTGAATALGGDVRVEKGGRVGGGATSVGGELRVAPGAVVEGDRSAVRAELDGVSLAQRILAAVSSALEGTDCRIQVRQERR